jgi:hypothetical protein
MSDQRDLEREIAEEDEVRAILRSTDQSIIVPPFTEVARRAESHRTVSPGLALAATALVVVVIVAGIGALRNAASTGVSSVSSDATLPPFSASTIPGSSSGAAIPTLSAQPGLRPEFAVIYDGIRQGYAKGSAPLVRREGETNIAVGELAPSFFEQFIGAVSPDGRRAIYFAQRQGEPWTLYLLDGAKPNDQRVLKTMPGEIPSGTPVWSSDGGIAYVVLDEGANQGVTPKYSAIRTLDISTGTVAEIARVNDGSAYSVVGWDRTHATVAAVLAPDRAPATKYLVFSGSGPRSWTLDGQYSMYAANSGDVAGTRCDASTKECSLWTWTLDDFGSRVDRKVGSNLSVIGWRDGTGELVLLTGAPGAVPDRVALWSASRGLRSIARVSGSGYSRPFLRADGSAVIVQASQTQALIVDLADGIVSPFPLHSPNAQFEPNRLRASIRIG